MGPDTRTGEERGQEVFSDRCEEFERPVKFSRDGTQRNASHNNHEVLFFFLNRMKRGVVFKIVLKIFLKKNHV